MSLREVGLDKGNMLISHMASARVYLQSDPMGEALDDKLHLQNESYFDVRGLSCPLISLCQ